MRLKRKFFQNFIEFEKRELMAALVSKPRMPASITPASLTGFNSMIPLDELTGTYKGETGGLYGNNQNVPTGLLADAVKTITNQIIPLNRLGTPDPKGKIGFVALGQSTTRMVFEQFPRMVSRNKASNVVLVNAGQDGVIAQNWAGGGNHWTNTLTKINKSGLSASQVQVAWIEVALLYPANYGDFQSHNNAYESYLQNMINIAKSQFPNLKIVYLSSRYYGGYTTRTTNPEPFAYESAFGIRDLILGQVSGNKTSLSNNLPNTSKQPLLLWGPYYWTNGNIPSKIDGLSWKPNDLEPDGIHPASLGRTKVANQLRDFFTTDTYAKQWFVRKV